MYGTRVVDVLAGIASCPSFTDWRDVEDAGLHTDNLLAGSGTRPISEFVKIPGPKLQSITMGVR